MDIAILYWVLVAVMVVGAIGAVLPGIPGSILILAAVASLGAVQSFSSVTFRITVLVLLLNVGIDFSQLLGSKTGRSKQVRDKLVL